MKNLMKAMLGLSMTMIAFEAAGEGAASAETAPAPAAEPAKSGRFTPDQITEIRSLRALKHPDGTEKSGKPVHTHAGLAAMFNTTAGVISQIVRNRSHKDPNYTPVNDGK